MADVAGENQCYSDQDYIWGLQPSDLDQRALSRPLLNMRLPNAFERKFEPPVLEPKNVMQCESFERDFMSYFDCHPWWS